MFNLLIVKLVKFHSVAGYERRSQWSSGSMSDCSARGPGIESRCGQLCLSHNHCDLQPWARAVCTFPAVPRSTQPSTLRGTVNEYQLSGFYMFFFWMSVYTVVTTSYTEPQFTAIRYTVHTSTATFIFNFVYSASNHWNRSGTALDPLGTNCLNGRQYKRQADSNFVTTCVLEEPSRATLDYMDENGSKWPELPQTHMDWSRQPVWELTALEAVGD